MCKQPGFVNKEVLYTIVHCIYADKEVKEIEKER